MSNSLLVEFLMCTTTHFLDQDMDFCVTDLPTSLELGLLTSNPLGFLTVLNLGAHQITPHQIACGLVIVDTACV